MTNVRVIDNPGDIKLDVKSFNVWKNQFIESLYSSSSHSKKSLADLWEESSDKQRAYLSGQPYQTLDGQKHQLLPKECIAIFIKILERQRALLHIADEILIRHKMHHLIKQIEPNLQAHILRMFFYLGLGDAFFKKYKVAVSDIEPLIKVYPEAPDSKRFIIEKWIKEMRPNWQTDPKIVKLFGSSPEDYEKTLIKNAKKYELTTEVAEFITLAYESLKMNDYHPLTANHSEDKSTIEHKNKTASPKNGVVE